MKRASVPHGRPPVTARPPALLRLLLALPLMAAGIPTNAVGGECNEHAPALETVRAFMAAFNSHDVDALRELLAPGVAWYSVGRESMVTEARGRQSLLAAMTSYFGDVPDVHSKMEQPVVTGSRVAFRERVSWDGGSHQQTAIAVYEVSDGRISRAWYFPSGD